MSTPCKWLLQLAAVLCLGSVGLSCSLLDALFLLGGAARGSIIAALLLGSYIKEASAQCPGMLSNNVYFDGKYYASLSDSSVTGSCGSACHNDYYRTIPSGWTLAPDNGATKMVRKLK